MAVFGVKTVLTVPKRHFRFTPNNGHQRTARHVSNMPKPDVLARLFLDRKWRATADEDGQYCFAVAL